MMGMETIDKNDKFISFAVCFQVTVVGIKNMLVQAIPAIYARNNMINTVLLALIAVVYIWAYIFSDNKMRLNSRTFSIIAFVIVSHMWSLSVYPANSSYIMSGLPRDIPYCFVTWYMITKLKTFDWVRFYMRKFSLAILCFAIVSAGFIFIQGHITTSDWSSYSMPLSYVTMVGVMWALMYYFESEHFHWLLLAAIGTLIIIMYGSRNPLLAIASYIVISVLRRSGGNGEGRFKYWIFSLVLLLAVFNIDTILSWLNSVLSSFGVSSRTLGLLSSGTSSESMFTSGRDSIHSTLIAAINHHPILGLGIGGDEAALAEAGMTQSAHSLYLSILSSYGYFIGILVLIYLVYLCVKALKKSTGLQREVLILYMCMVWPRGFTGGDVWSSDVFWWMLGLVCVVCNGQIIVDSQIPDAEYDSDMCNN